MKILLILFIISFLTACSSNEIILPAEPVPMIVEEKTVSINQVAKPDFDKTFASLVTEEEIVGVKWGVVTNGGSYFLKESGFPGFDYPICIVGYSCTDSIITLSTLYGEYNYSYIENQSAILQEGKIISSEGDNLINFYRLGELLYLYKDGKLNKYKLVDGTTIVF